MTKKEMLLTKAHCVYVTIPSEEEINDTKNKFTKEGYEVFEVTVRFGKEEKHYTYEEFKKIFGYK